MFVPPRFYCCVAAAAYPVAIRAIVKLSNYEDAFLMEPMVVCALGIVVYCGYLTVKDIVTDLHQEGIMVRPLFNKGQ